MNVILDLVVLVIFALTVFLTARKGFIRSFFGLLSLFIAILFARYVTPVFQPPVENVIQTGIVSYLDTNFARIGNTTVSNIDINALISEQPDEFVQILKSFQIDTDQLSQYIGALSDDAAHTGTAITASAISYIAQPISNTLAFLIVFVCLFFIGVLLCLLITFIANKIFSLPVLSAVNHFSGFLLGVVFALLQIELLAALVRFANNWLGSMSSNIFSLDTIKNTLVFHWFYDYNFIYDIIFKGLFHLR